MVIIGNIILTVLWGAVFSFGALFLVLMGRLQREEAEKR